MQLVLAYETGLGNFGSDVSFSKFTAVYESYLTVSSRHTLRPRLTLGFADATLPAAEQLSAERLVVLARRCPGMAIEVFSDDGRKLAP